MDNDRLYELKGDMELLHHQMRNKVKKIELLSQTLTDMQHNLWKQKMEFEAMDRELAMLDGRFKNCNHVRPTAPKAKPMIQMSREQILAIARELGVTIDI